MHLSLFPIFASLVFAHSPSILAANATVPSSSALASIIGLIGSNCQSSCAFFTADLAACAKGADQASIATCACSSQVLGDIRSCASCISSDPTTSTTNSTAAVNSYNSFVNLCSEDGLAQITGTVLVGAPTSTASRSVLNPSTINSASKATYSLNSASAPVATVPSLAPNSANGSTGSTSSHSATATGSTTPALTAGTGKLSIGLGSLLAFIALV